MSQHSEIIKVLKRNYKSGVPNHRFTQMRILDYTARISELRQDGHNILAQRQYVKGKWTGTWVYKLIEERE